MVLPLKNPIKFERLQKIHKITAFFKKAKNLSAFFKNDSNG